MQIALKFFGIDQTFIDRFFTFNGKIRLVADGFDTFLYPGLLRRILNMHKFNAYCATIGFPQPVNNFTKRRGFQTKHMIDENRAIPVIIAKPIAFRIKLRVQRLVFK